MLHIKFSERDENVFGSRSLTGRAALAMTRRMAENHPPLSGYKRALERHPELSACVMDFSRWLEAVEEWLVWVENNIPENVHASRTEVLESLYVTPLGLELLERLKLDIYPEGREDISRVEYDLKKVLRAVVALPTLARLRGKKLDRKSKTINTVFKEIIDDTLNGRSDVDAISDWEPPKPPSSPAAVEVSPSSATDK